MKKPCIQRIPMVGVFILLLGVCGCRTTENQPAVAASPGEAHTGYQPIQSKEIYSVNYDVAAQVLTVVLYEDGAYDYAAVPKEVYDGLLKAEDRDQYYRDVLVKGYQGKKFSMP